MGGSPSYTIQQPAAPTPPTASQTAEDFSRAYPIYYQTALQYEPQVAQMEKNIQEGLYPQEAALRKQIGQQTSERLSQDIPTWYKQNVADTLKSTLGRNLLYNPLAQEDYGLKTNQAYQDWNNYYTNVGLSMAGRVPVTTPNNLMSSYTPQASMGYASNMFGTQAGIYGAQAGMYNNNYNTNAQLMTQNNPWNKLSMGWSSKNGLNFGYGG